MKTDLVTAEETALIPRGPLDSHQKGDSWNKGYEDSRVVAARQSHDSGSLREQVLAARNATQGVSALSWLIHGGLPRAERAKGRRAVPVLGANGRFSFYSPAQVRAMQVAGRIYIGPRGGWVTAPVYRLAVKAARRGGGELRLRKTLSTPASSKGRRK